MSVNNRSYLSAAFGVILPVTAVVAQATSRSSDPASLGMTSGRLVATSAALVALIGAVVGGVALLRPTGVFGTSMVRLGAIVAGLIGVAVGGSVVATTTNFGTGGGRAGAIVALVFGVLAIALGGMALARSRRASEGV